MAENQEWNLNQVVASPTNTTQPTNNEWNVNQPVAPPPIPNTTQQTNQQWGVAAEQWNVQQPQKPPLGAVTQQTEQQWNGQKPQLESGQWNVAQAGKAPDSTQQWTGDQLPPQTGVVPETTAQPTADASKQTVVTQPAAAQPISVNQQDAATKDAAPVEPSKPIEGWSATQESVTPKQPTVPPTAAIQPEASKSTGGGSVAPEQAVATPASVVESVPPSQPTVPPTAAKEPSSIEMTPKPQVAPQDTMVQPSVHQGSTPEQPAAPSGAVAPVAPEEQVAPQQQQATVAVTSIAAEPTSPKNKVIFVQPAISQTVVKSTTQVSMQPNVSHQGVPQVSQAQQSHGPAGNVPQPATKPKPQQTGVQPAVKPKPSASSQDTYQLKREGGDEIPLEEKQKGVFWLGPDLEGWVDKTKALKEEFRRQGDANETYFIKNLQELDLKTLNVSEDASKYIYRVTDLKGVDVVNLLRCVLNEYHHSEPGPFFFEFGEDKKFKLELLPTATQPGNGLIKTVGRRKYYSYPDMCSMLKSSGVTSKGLGIMLQKLNTSGLKSALNNKISPMNELHFMLLYEVARRLVRGPHGFSLSTEPEMDQLPVGVAVGRMISMFCRGNYCLNYEAVLGVRDKYNPFIDNSVVLRRQKIYALNKLFYDAEVRSQAGENPYIAKFLKYHNGYIIKTTKGYLDELDMAFRGF